MTAKDRGLAELEAIARLLDDRFRIPGTSIRFGLDGLLGLVPGIGDGATALVSLYVVLRAWSLGAPSGVLGRMLVNILVDSAIGSIPLLGDVFDVAFKSNRRNLELLRRHLAEVPGAAPAARR